MKASLNRREFLRAAVMTAVGAAAASCAQPTPQVIEKPITVVVDREVPIQKEVLTTVIVEKEVPVEKVVQQTVVVEKQVEKVVQRTVVVEKQVEKVVEKVVTATVVPSKFKEAPMLADMVKAGQLPPVEERLPQNPLVVQPTSEVGTYGGSWTMVVGTASDTKLAHAYGYTRLVGWNQQYSELVPDLCESFEAANGSREFTFHLRKGLRWSDGEPFTSDDFRFYWEEVANNEEMSPGGPSDSLRAGGEVAGVTFIDAYTFKYAWPLPNNAFLLNLAGGSALNLYRPKHYMRQFHAKYAEQAALDQALKEGAHENWMALFGTMDRQYYMDNPDLPVMQPWLPSERPPQDKYVHARNPFYHKVDPDGNQLPYLDEFVQISTDGKLISLKCSQGDSDFQSRNLTFDDITLLKENEAAGDYAIYLWPTSACSLMYIYPNQTCNDEVMRELNRDKRWRIALSHAIDRSEINQVLFLGYGIEQQPEILPGMPGYNAEFALAHTEFDLDRANALLDEIGLKWDANHEYRLRPDGATLDVLIEDAGEQVVYADILEIIGDSWKQIGVKILHNITDRNTMRNRSASGEASFSNYIGQGGKDFFWAPDCTRKVPLISGMACAWGPAYGLWNATDGQEGIEPPPEVKEVQELTKQWLIEEDKARRAELFYEIRAIFAQERFEIGTVGGLPNPVVVKNGFRNVPKVGFHDWATGGYLGWLQPSQCWKE